MTRVEIEEMVQPMMRRNISGSTLLLWTCLAIIAGTLVCEGMYLFAFRTNPVMMSLGVLMTSFTLGFLVYGIGVARELAALDRSDESLVPRLQRRLLFHGSRHEVWLWMVTLTTVFLSFAVSTTLDAQDGQYRVNQPLVFIGTLAAQVLLVYTALKLGHYPLIREVRAILSDLEQEVTTETDDVQILKKTWRRWGWLLTILLTLLMLLGLYLSWR